MSYKTLRSIFHALGAAEAEHERVRRARSAATVSWPLALREDEFFCHLVPEVALRLERIYRNEFTVHALWRDLPGPAAFQFVSSLIVHEIMSTNDIEGIHSTRAEVEDALRAARRRTEPRRLRELAGLYLGLFDDPPQNPRSLPEVRGIYENATQGEIDPRSAPDGDLFRAGRVTIEDGAGAAVHHGFFPEASIASGLRVILETMGSEDRPPLLTAVASHLLFEIVHPFYDGNGRTGRYLLALALTRVLSPMTGLMTSRAIDDAKRAYYKAFSTAEDPLNRGDLTPSVIALLSILEEGQSTMLEELEAKREALRALNATLDSLQRSGASPGRSELDLLYVFGQNHLFADGAGLDLDELMHHMGRSRQSVRRYAAALQERGHVEALSHRPLVYVLTSSGRALLQLPEIVGA